MMQLTQSDRFRLLAGELGPLEIARKRARLVAVVATDDGTVETDRGPMTFVAGDIIATNHPDDDATSDLWSISRERYDATYETVAEMLTRRGVLA